MGSVGILLFLHSPTGDPVSPPVMRAAILPGRELQLHWPGIDWFAEPPGLRWRFARVPD